MYLKSRLEKDLDDQENTFCHHFQEFAVLISEYIFGNNTFKSSRIFIIYYKGIFVEVVLILKSGIMREEYFDGRKCFLNFS